MRILVTGGAGYIGSHVVRRLVSDKHKVFVVDNLSEGHRAAVHPKARFYKAHIEDIALMTRMLKIHKIDCVMHFAANAYVRKSFKNPLKYWDNNTLGTMDLMRAMLCAGTPYMIFSSSCATYGNTDQIITETTPQWPVSPYGHSKLAAELFLRSMACSVYRRGIVALRYFNAAGCEDMFGLGEDHRPETHLIPVLLRCAYRQAKFVVYGKDFDTPDGTCIRDYIHVTDLVSAHVAALNVVQEGEFQAFNLGNGRGYSVLEVLNMCKKVAGSPIFWKSAKRKPGDPARLCADNTLARQKLNWTPQFPELHYMVESTWNWIATNPLGYDTPPDSVH